MALAKAYGRGDRGRGDLIFAERMEKCKRNGRSWKPYRIEKAITGGGREDRADDGRAERGREDRADDGHADDGRVKDCGRDHRRCSAPFCGRWCCSTRGGGSGATASAALETPPRMLAP